MRLGSLMLEEAVISLARIHVLPESHPAGLAMLSAMHLNAWSWSAVVREKMRDGVLISPAGD